MSSMIIMTQEDQTRGESFFLYQSPIILRYVTGSTVENGTRIERRLKFRGSIRGLCVGCVAVSNVCLSLVCVSVSGVCVYVWYMYRFVCLCN